MSISILSPDGDRLANNGTNGISILGPDGALLPNDGTNGVSILDAEGALKPYEEGNSYSILTSDGALAPYQEGNSFSILTPEGSLMNTPGALLDANDVSSLAGEIRLMFRDGVQGAWYDPSNRATLFQDAAGTTPVTADGQPVGRMLDLSGNGNHATQSTAAFRPLYRTALGLSWLYFDGVDDFLRAEFAVVAPIDRVSGILPTTVTNDRYFFANCPPDFLSGVLVRLGPPPDLAIFAGLITGIQGGVDPSPNIVVTERYDGAASRLAVAARPYVSGDAGSAAINGITIASGHGVAYAEMGFFGLIMRGGPTPMTNAQITTCRLWCASRAGVTL